MEDRVGTRFLGLKYFNLLFLSVQRSSKCLVKSRNGVCKRYDCISRRIGTITGTVLRVTASTCIFRDDRMTRASNYFFVMYGEAFRMLRDMYSGLYKLLNVSHTVLNNDIYI